MSGPPGHRHHDNIGVRASRAEPGPVSVREALLKVSGKDESQAARRDLSTRWAKSRRGQNGGAAPEAPAEG